MCAVAGVVVSEVVDQMSSGVRQDLKSLVQ